MKNFCLSFLCTLLHAVLICQTNVGGPLFTNTTWGLAGSPFLLTSDVQVAPGVTLTIESGVQIQFSGDQEILVKGTIHANGTSTSNIQLSGNTGKAMIHFKSANLSHSQLTHIVFTGPKAAILLGDDPAINTGTLYVDGAEFNSTFIKTAGQSTSAKLVIENANLNQTRVTGAYPLSEPIDLRYTYFYESLVESEPYNLGITLTNCTAKYSTFTSGCCGALVTVVNSTLNNSRLSLPGSSSNGGHAKAMHTKFNSSVIDFTYGQLDMEDCQIYYDSLNAISIGNGYVNCTHISGAGTGTAINVTGYSAYTNPPFTMYKTRLTNSGTGLYVSGQNSFNIDSCSFYLNGIHVNNESPKDFTIKSSYFGSTDSTTLAAKIKDYYDNINYGKVKLAELLSGIFLPPGCPDTVIKVLPPPPPTLLREENRDSHIRLFPNPASGFLIINSDTEIGNVQVINQLGQVVIQKFPREKAVTLKVDQLPAGVYYCRISTMGFSEVRKVVLR